MTSSDEVATQIARAVNLACLLEASAPKPGNVHRGADFEDLTYLDLIHSGMAIAPWLAAAPHVSLGTTVRAAVEATHEAVGTNSNLGIILLLAPLAKADADLSEAGLATVLDGITARDADDVYAAIRRASAGGLGRVDEGDVAEAPTLSLRDAMQAAADRDLVARQYTNGFEQVRQRVLPRLCAELDTGRTLGQAIVVAHLDLMAEFPDSLIARKCGIQTAHQAADRAATVLDSGTPGDENFRRALADLDFWLRADGHRRNPGTSADLITAGLYLGLRTGRISASGPFYPAC